METINLLNRKYSLLGIDEDVCGKIKADLENQDLNQKLDQNLRTWLTWRNKKISENKDILVCDPYKMYGNEANNKDRAEAAYIKICEETKINSKSNEEVCSILQEMFDQREKEKTIYSMQYTTVLAGTTFPCVIFIDVDSVKTKCREEYLIPLLLHETTHYMEERSCDTGCLWKDENFEAMKTESIWPEETRKETLYGRDEKWKAIFDSETEYQKNNREERMTTLIERIAIGSLYGTSEDTDWVERLKNKLKEVLLSAKVLSQNEVQ